MKHTKRLLFLGVCLASIMLFAVFQPVQAAEYPIIINADIGHYEPAGTIAFEEVKVQGDYAYVADCGYPSEGDSHTVGKLRVISLSNPASPSQVASRDISYGHPYNIKLDNNRAYLRLLYDVGIYVFDITTPTSPVDMGNMEFASTVDFDVHSNILYLSSLTELRTYDVTTPFSPVLKDTLNMGGNGSITVSGNYAYMCIGISGIRYLKIINVTDVNDLILESTLNIGTFIVESFYVSGSYLFAVGLDSSLPSNQPRGVVKVFDITDLENPTVLGSLLVGGIDLLGIQLLGSNLITGACKAGINFIDFSTPSDMEITGRYTEYQSVYCGGEHYAKYPQLYDHMTYGKLLVFVSMGCGLNIMEAENYDYYILDIPGPSPILLMAILFVSILIVSKKIKILHRN